MRIVRACVCYVCVYVHVCMCACLQPKCAYVGACVYVCMSQPKQMDTIGDESLVWIQFENLWANNDVVLNSMGIIVIIC